MYSFAKQGVLYVVKLGMSSQHQMVIFTRNTQTMCSDHLSVKLSVAQA